MNKVQVYHLLRDMREARDVYERLRTGEARDYYQLALYRWTDASRKRLRAILDGRKIS